MSVHSRPLLLCCYSAVIFVMSSLALPAQDAFWQPLGGPFGGRLVGLLRLSSDEIIVGTENNGIFHSSDDGMSWHRPAALRSTALPLLQTSAGVLFAFSDQDGLLRSLDDGKSWQTDGEGLPTDGQMLAMVEDDEGAVLLATTSSGIFRSADPAAAAGSVWESFALEEDGLLALVTRDGATMYAGTFGRAIMLSRDRGNTWVQIVDGLPEGFSQRSVTAIAFGEGETMFAGLFRAGIFRSENGGLNWELFALEDTDLTSLRYLSDGRLLAGTLSQGAFLVSADGGTSRKMQLPGDEIPSVEIAADGALLAAMLGGGLQRSTDAGESWTQVGLPITRVKALLPIANGDLISVSDKSGLHRFNSNSQTWRYLDFINTSINAIASNPNGDIFIGGERGQIFRSQDGGATWFATDSDAVSTEDINAVAAGANDVVLAGSGQGLLFSSDNGTSWRNIALGIEGGIRTLSSGTGQTYRFFAGLDLPASIPVATLLSMDGLNWQRADISLFGAVQAFAVGGNSALALAALTADGTNSIAYTRDDGSTWNTTSDDAFNASIAGLVFDKNGAIVAAAAHEVLRLEPGKDAWQTLGSGLPTDQMLTSLVADSEEVLYVGVDGAGVFRTLGPITAVSEDNGAPSARLAVQATIPGGETGRITLDLPSAGPLQLNLISMRGVRLASIWRGELSSGRHELPWEGAAVPAGPYILELVTQNASAGVLVLLKN